MGYRVDKVSISMDVCVEFVGPVRISFAFTPSADGSDKHLVDALLAKNDAINLAAAKAAGPASIDIS